MRGMTTTSSALPPAPLPADLAAAHAMIVAERTGRLEAEAEAAAAKAEISGARLMIEHLKLTIAKLKRERYGQASERGQRILDQLELDLAELEESAAEDETAAEIAAASRPGTEVRSFLRRKPARRPFPEHLPRERIVHPAPSACPCCGGRLAKLGEDVTETLEVVPRRWKVLQHVREKFTCRSCERITQPPAPTHAIARGRSGASLLAMILYAKYGQHQPLNRQRDVYAREGVELDVSTMADHVGACAATLHPLVALIRDHVFAAARIHADDTTVPVLAKGRTRTGRLWDYVRDDRPWAGPAPPAVAFFYSADRGGTHPEAHLAGYSGIMQADAYAGFNRLYQVGRKPGPIIEAACWSHARRKFYELAAVTKAPIAAEAVRRIDQLFEIEREIVGSPAEVRAAIRGERVAPLVAELAAWMGAQRAAVSGKSAIGKALDYSLKRWPALTRFLDDGRICLTNNAAERAIRGVALGRKSWTFAGSDRGGERAAAMYTLIETAKLNGIDPQAWLADALARIGDHPARRLHELLPWNWAKPAIQAAAA
jgi:transposase